MQEFRWVVDILFGISMFANGSLFIPQAWKLFKRKNAAGVSLMTFLGFNLIQMVIVAHGYLREDWQLVFGMGYSFITCSAVTMLILIYGNRDESTQNA